MNEYMLIDKDDNCYFVESDNIENAINVCCIENDLVRSDIVDWNYAE